MTTPIQQKIYQFIQDYINEHGYSPALVEIARGIGISPKSISLVSRSIHALADAGRLRFHKKGYRNIQLVEGEQRASLPLLGRIAAGVPIEVIENRQSIDLAGLFDSTHHFVLQVKGESMVEEGMFDGDLVVCRLAQRANEGDMVFALIDGREAALKRVSYQIQDRITLIPANTSLKPKAYLPHRVQIQGVFAGLVRLQGPLVRLQDA